MNRRIRFATLIVIALLIVACHPPLPPNLTPEEQQQYTTIYTADQVLIRIQELQNVVIQAESNGGIPTNTARPLVQFTVDAAKTLKTLPEGWKTTVKTLWETVKANPYVKPYLTNVYVSVAVGLVDSAINSWSAK